MRTITTTTDVFYFEELSEEAQGRAVEKLWDLNIDRCWYDYIYSDAEDVDLKITAFDLVYGNMIEGHFLGGAKETAEAILQNHGKICDTYTLAEAYLTETAPLREVIDDMNNGDWQDAEDSLEEADKEFERALLGAYLSKLREEFEYLQSEEAIIETIKLNEYEFTIDGKLYQGGYSSQ